MSRRSSRVTARPVRYEPLDPRCERDVQLIEEERSEVTIDDSTTTVDREVTIDDSTTVKPSTPYLELALTLSKLITSDDGRAPFRQLVHLTPHLRLSGIGWQYNPAPYDQVELTIVLNFQPTPFGSMYGIAHTTRDPTASVDVLAELLRRTHKIRHCSSC